MSYLPVELLRPSKVPDLKGLAIVFPLMGRQEVMLVTDGPDAHVCFLEGGHVGEGFRKDRAERWEGLAIEGVEIEVDQDSQFQPAMVRQPLGTIIRSGAATELLVSVKENRGFAEGVRVPLSGVGTEDQHDLEVGFTKWRAVITVGTERRTIFEFSATTKGDM